MNDDEHRKGPKMSEQAFQELRPTAPERTTAALDAVDALVRYCNNATSTRDGIGMAPQVYDHVCEVLGAVEQMSQRLAQLRRWADDAAEDGTLRHDQHRADADQGASVAQNTAARTSWHLTDAGEHARKLAASLRSARAQVVHLCHDLPQGQ